MFYTSKDLQAIARNRAAVVVFDECFEHKASGATIQVALIVQFPANEAPHLLATYLDTKDGFVQLPYCTVDEEFLRYVEDTL